MTFDRPAGQVLTKADLPATLPHVGTLYAAHCTFQAGAQLGLGPDLVLTLRPVFFHL